MSILLTLGRTAAVFSMVALAACGGGDDDGVGVVPDAGGGGDDPDADTAPACTVEANLGNLGALANAQAGQQAQEAPLPAGNADAKLLFVGALISADDAFEIALWDGYGAFKGASGEGDVMTGTFPITGDETGAVSCGVCVRLLGNVNLETGAAEQGFIATAGSVTISDITGNLTGTATGLVFGEIDEANENGNALAGGCASAVSDVTFDVALAAP